MGWARELKGPLAVVEVLARNGCREFERHYHLALPGKCPPRQWTDAPLPAIPTSSQNRVSADGRLVRFRERLASW